MRISALRGIVRMIFCQNSIFKSPIDYHYRNIFISMFQSQQQPFYCSHSPHQGIVPIPSLFSSSPSTTESQIISTLNSSIEDLLTKIYKVTGDYQTSNREDNIAYYPENTCFFTAQNQISHQSHPLKEDTKTQGSVQQSNTKIELMSPIKFKKKASVFSRAKTGKLSSSSPNNLIETIQTGSLKQINQISQPTKNTIYSLFDNKIVKEVAESRIFGQPQDEGSWQKLQQNISSALNKSIIKDKPIKEELRLSDFQIGKEVGSGKFGQVYICRHRGTGMLFALKKIFKSTLKQYRMEDQFCLQLKIMYMIDHPNIVKLYGHFCDQYHVFLLMEYAEGGQLMEHLGSDERYVSRVIKQLLDAVEYLHSRGIVHRDIKPENIVMTFDNTAKLCDFGWAGLYDLRTMKTTFCGTLDYVSPEMKDKGKYTFKVDLWSLGVLCFELLTKVIPFRSEITNWRRKGSNLKQQWDWNILYPPEISGLAESFMRNLLKENPDERASLRFCKNHLFIRKHGQQEQSYIQFHI